MSGLGWELLQQELTPVLNSGRALRFALAYSGGLDSTVLLHLLAAWREAQGTRSACLPPLLAFHVHHGLSPHADAWLAHCAEQAQALGLAFDSQRVQLPPEPENGIEEAARLARYAALGTLCARHQVSHLLTAHHLDDQAETVLLQLLRGSGIAGLRGMPQQQQGERLLAQEGISILRPLLGVSRAQLQAWAQARALVHIEDESNADPRYTRNALRLQVMPVLEQIFPAFQTRLARAAGHAQAAQRLLQQLAQQDLQQCAAGEGSLHLSALRELDPDRRDNLLRYWLAQHDKRMPSSAWLQEMWQQLDSEDDNAQPCITHPQAQIRRYRARVFLTPRLDLLQFPEETQVFRWQGESRIEFPAWHGCLHLQAAGEAGQGLNPDWLRAQNLSLHPRRGGERLRLAANRPSRSLKQHFQSLDVPPWERNTRPLISAGGQLLYVPGVGIEGSLLQAGGVVLRWEYL